MISQAQWERAALDFLKRAIDALQTGDYHKATLAAEDAHTTLEELDLVTARRRTWATKEAGL